MAKRKKAASGVLRLIEGGRNNEDERKREEQRKRSNLTRVELQDAA